MKPRICVPTWRAFNKAAFNCSLYEFQDVLQETDDIDLLCLEAGAGFRLKQRVQRPLLYRPFTGRLAFRNPGLKRVCLVHEYEMFVAVCQTFWDLLYVDAIDGWKDRCKTSVCWINEIWAKSIPYYENCLRALDHFEHVFVSLKSAAPALSVAIGRKVHWLPAGVDALRFSPFPEAPERAVDVYSIGRRRHGIHESLIELAATKRIFYIYDTLHEAATMAPLDSKQHRELYANTLKRAHYFMVAPAKMNDPTDSKGEMEIGFRYYEGAAAGAVMLGETPKCEHYLELFGWPDAVIEVKPDGSDVRDVLARLSVEPARTVEMSRRNAAEALLRHDWVYRWRDIYRVAGVAPSSGMVARERKLAALASIARGQEIVRSRADPSV